MRNINEGYPRRQSAKLEKKISHREYQERLSGTVGEKLVADLCKNTKAVKVAKGFRIPVSYKTTEEVVIREEKERRQDGTAMKKTRKIDAVIFVEPGDRALCQDWDFTIGFEVKATSSNLLKDQQPDIFGVQEAFFRHNMKSSKMWL